MELTKVYKYRGIEDIDRDLNAVEQNYFFAPKPSDLNDPCEAFVSKYTVLKQLKMFEQLFKNINTVHTEKIIENFINTKDKMGIYSLSKTYKDELMWAHYSSSHKGFCIEYDFNTLFRSESKHEFHKIQLEYADIPPKIELDECFNPTLELFLQKMVGTKSRNWEYEKEIRIVTDRYGKQYYDFEAVKAIYFGYRMCDEHKIKIMSKLRGRNILFYDIELKKNSYVFKHRIREDEFKDSRKYFGIFYRENNDSHLPKTVKYKILKRTNQLFHGWGRLEIQLEHKLTDDELKDLCLKIKDTIYGCIDDVTVNFFIDDSKSTIAWAYARYNMGKIDIKIIGSEVD